MAIDDNIAFLSAQRALFQKIAEQARAAVAVIRLKWAYQLGLLEVARSGVSNHLGVVIFDEPRQQKAAKTSFAALLKRAAEAKRFRQQVIFATSEDRSELERLLEGLDVALHVEEGWIIKPILLS